MQSASHGNRFGGRCSMPRTSRPIMSRRDAPLARCAARTMRMAPCRKLPTIARSTASCARSAAMTIGAASTVLHSTITGTPRVSSSTSSSSGIRVRVAVAPDALNTAPASSDRRVATRDLCTTSCSPQVRAVLAS